MTHAASVPDQVLGEIASHYPDLQETWSPDAWHLTAIDSTRGHSRNLMLMHPSYVLVHDSDYWAFSQRPHGLLDLVLGDRDVSFPTILPIDVDKIFTVQRSQQTIGAFHSGPFTC